MNRNLIEIASWSFTSELVRQMPNQLKLIETHPGGGQYDCLSVIANQKLLCHFNRVGSLTVFRTLARSLTRSKRIDIWEGLSRESPQSLMESVCKTLSIKTSHPRPKGTHRSLTYRTIAAFLRTTAFGGSEWRCINGYLDTSGYGGGIISDFEQFPEARRRLANNIESDFLGVPAYRFWFLRLDGKPVACLEDNGSVWSTDGSYFQLMDLYARRRNVADITAEIAAGLAH